MKTLAKDRNWADIFLRTAMLQAAVLITCTMWGQIALSPQVISSQGGQVTTGVYQLSWTLGEVAVTTNNDRAFMLTEGFHQPLIILHETPLVEDFDREVIAFPNPATTRVHVKVSAPLSYDLPVEVHDMTGRLVIRDNLPAGSDLIQLDVGRFYPGTYLIVIRDDTGRQSWVNKFVKIQ